MARPGNTVERRAQIARALLKVMARRGYDGASIAAVAGYALASTLGAGPWLLSLCAARHLASGMATAALFTCMMDWSSTEAGASGSLHPAERSVIRAEA